MTKSEKRWNKLLFQRTNLNLTTRVGGVLWIYFITLVISGCLGTPAGSSLQGFPMSAVLSVENGRAELPCDLTSSLLSADDKVKLLLWFKLGYEHPVYSVDLRSYSNPNGSHIVGTDFGSRAKLDLFSNPSYLVLEPAKASDAGIYRCRVDFRKGPTRYEEANLTVIEPPQEVVILDELGTKVGEVHMASEASTVVLTCECSTGNPPPRVTWWRGATLIDNSYDTVSPEVVRNDLILPQVSRPELHSTYTCQASNSNLTMPASKTIKLDLILKPLSAQISGPNEPMSARKQYELRCESYGSRPPPQITWIKGSKRVKHAKEHVYDDGNFTVSTLTITAQPEDNGKIVTCRVENPGLHASNLEDRWLIDVFYSPVATLELGSSLRMDNLKEGDDVYFECNIKANPRVYKVDWKFEGQFLSHNISAGIIISNQSLVLQKVRRTSVGGYTCVAKNVEGDGVSNAIMLKIKHSPYCKPGQKLTYGVARHETVKVQCEVIANPVYVNFKWSFNSSQERLLDMARSRYTSNELKSELTYVPRTEFDYGLLFCSGGNEIGDMREPCVFHIVPAGFPDPLRNCTIMNQTEDTISVFCSEGFDGGLLQAFYMEMYDSTTHKLKLNVTSSHPYFEVEGLDPATGFSIQLYSANLKGRSEKVFLLANTLPMAERRMGNPVLLTITPMLIVLMVIVAVLVCVAVTIVLVMKCRSDYDGEKQKKTNSANNKKDTAEMDMIDKSITPIKQDFSQYDRVGEKSPDLVPNEDTGADRTYEDAEMAGTTLLNNVNDRRLYENPINSRLENGHVGSTPYTQPNTYQYNQRTTGNGNYGRPITGQYVMNKPVPPKRGVSATMNCVKSPNGREEVQYAELQLLDKGNANIGYHNAVTQPLLMANQNEVIYAQIDHGKKMRSPPMADHEDIDRELMEVEAPLMNNHKESTV